MVGLADAVACILSIVFEAKADSEVGDEIDIVEDGQDIPSGEYIGGVDGWVHFIVFTVCVLLIFRNYDADDDRESLGS